MTGPSESPEMALHMPIGWEAGIGAPEWMYMS